jgi:hypothetical protein
MAAVSISCSPAFMSATGPSKSPAARPAPARVPSSNAEEFRRPLKAHTFNGSSSTDPLNRPPPAIKPDAPDAFETNADADNDDDSDGLDVARGSIDLSDLPIELVSLTDRSDRPPLMRLPSASADPTTASSSP